MKKTFCFLIMILLLCMAGCEQADPIDSQTTAQTEAQTEHASPTPLWDATYDNMESFLADWPQGGQLANTTAAGMNSTGSEATITVPVLKSTNFVLHHIAVNRYAYFFYYVSADHTKPYFSSDDGITVTISRESQSFAAVVDQLNLTPVNGIAYVASYNVWYMDKNGSWISVRFPKAQPVTTENGLYSYFDFEEYTASDSTGEVQ